VTGYSNGGAFSAAVAFQKPKFFGVAIPLSLGIPPAPERPSSPMPRMYFAAGSLESFSASTTQVYELVRSWGVESSLDIYVAGHDPAMWSLAFGNVPSGFAGPAAFDTGITPMPPSNLAMKWLACALT